MYSLRRTYGLAFHCSFKGNQTKSFLGNSKVTTGREQLGMTGDLKAVKETRRKHFGKFEGHNWQYSWTSEVK